MRWLRRVFYLLAAIAVLVGLGTFVPRPLVAPDDEGPRNRQILVLSNPIHTDIAIPIDDGIRQRFSFLLRDGMPLDAPGARWLLFGWGGRAFYIETPTWSQLKLVPLLKGLTVDAAAMHVEVAGELDLASPSVAAYEITAPGFERLLGHIRSTFVEESGEPVLIPGAAYGDTDNFYEAKGVFSALLGCNTWTARGLRAAGLRTGWWNPLPVLLGWSMRLYN